MLKVATKLGSFQHNRTGAKMAQFFVLRFSFFFLISCIWGFIFSGCGEQGLLTAGASHCRGVSYCRAWVPGHATFSSFGSHPLDLRLRSCG